MAAKRVFLDANVLFAAGFKPDGDYARMLEWTHVRFVTSEHVLYELAENLSDWGRAAEPFVSTLRQRLEVTDRFVKLPTGIPLADDEDRQALAEAIGAECDEFVTFDRGHFGELFGTSVLGVRVRHSGEFLRLYRPT